MSNFWDVVWLTLSTFVFVAYLLVLFHIVLDLFRDTELGGFAKALWIIGLIFLPLTLIASFFGMNVHLPFEDSRNAFWIIIATMFAVVIGVAFFFRRRGWL